MRIEKQQGLSLRIALLAAVSAWAKERQSQTRRAK
jgi:hypothetical protein